MVWYRWKLWRFAWNLNSSNRVDCSGWIWKRLIGRLMFRCHRTEPRVFRVTDGEKCYSCESYYDHFLLRPEDGGTPWTTVDLSLHGLRKC